MTMTRQGSVTEDDLIVAALASEDPLVRAFGAQKVKEQADRTFPPCCFEGCEKCQPRREAGEITWDQLERLLR